jgi:hypothetical protein
MSQFWIGYSVAWLSVVGLVAFAILVTRCIAVGMGREDQHEASPHEFEPLA